MRIGLYGMPAAGKTHILNQLDFINVLSGSSLLRETCPEFDMVDEQAKSEARKNLAEQLLSLNNFIMDGHYSFGDEIAFTDMDGKLYDTFLYLYISPKVLEERMAISERNKKYLSFDVAKWQMLEIDKLREYCHENNKDFYVIDNPVDNVFDDVSDIIEFIRTITNGYSCKRLATECVERILQSAETDTVILMDGDKTITIEDSSHAVFGHSTNIYDGNFYTGYQSWKQATEFCSYAVSDLLELPITLNEKVCNAIGSDTYILTSGHEKVWGFISNYLGVPYYCGCEMSAETKYFITKMLQDAGKRVVAYGDGMNDYFMLKQADRGYLVPKENGAISRSLNGKDLGGIEFV